jgi:hypothetical protein
MEIWQSAVLSKFAMRLFQLNIMLIRLPLYVLDIVQTIKLVLKLTEYRAWPEPCPPLKFMYSTSGTYLPRYL